MSFAVRSRRVAQSLPEPHLPGSIRYGALMRHSRFAAVVAATLFAVPLMAQQPAAPPGTLEVGPKVGETAPDFEFTGITRYGKLAQAQKLSDFRGQTVVLAFFPKSRTRG